MKRISIVLTIALYLLISHTMVLCQSELDQNNTIYNYKKIHKNHPDGTLGKLSLSAGASYLSIKNQPGEPIIDAQKFKADIGWIISESFTQRQSFMIIKEFQTTYSIGLGFSYYFSNPLQPSVRINPDGKIGSPIFLFDANFLLSNLEQTKTQKKYKAQILFPLSPSFSFFAGYTSYNEIRPKDNEKIFGGLHLFLSSYKPTSRYSNPDSPLSGMSISLSGGSGEYGNFGQLGFAVPASQSVTVQVSARGDFLEAPFDKVYTGSLQIRYYTGK